MRRPQLCEVPVKKILYQILNGPALVVVTMSPDQWDDFLQGAYDRGYTLLEVDEFDIPRRAYQKDALAEAKELKRLFPTVFIGGK